MKTVQFKSFLPCVGRSGRPHIGAADGSGWVICGASAGTAKRSSVAMRRFFKNAGFNQRLSLNLDPAVDRSPPPRRSHVY